MAEYSIEEIRRIEKKWQHYWLTNKTFKAVENANKPSYYTLDMFPYPSGAGLHVGHPLGYIATDIVSRFKRQKGFNVLHPMGFDAFGLPAEQYAIQTGQHPAITTEQNIARYLEQLKNIGFAYDWDREVRTSDPTYYRWTQWIFMQLFNSWYNKKSNRAEAIESLIQAFEREGNSGVEAVCDEDTPAFSAADWKAKSPKEQQHILLKYRLTYISEAVVNWCPALGTVLSNDEVKDGFSERGGHPVERKKMSQWSMRITAYADRLLSGLDTIDWPEQVKEMQRNWIGKSLGCQLKFSLTPSPSPRERGTPGYMTANPDKYGLLIRWSRENRKNQTEAEQIIWQRIRNHKVGHKIRRQHPICDFIVDFVCLDRQIAIEIDGEYHNHNQEYDAQRTEFLNEAGFEVIRFTNQEVLTQTDSVVERIKAKLDQAKSIKEISPLPGRGVRGEAIEVFTTRVDTIFGATFLVIAPEHELVDQITTEAQRQAVTEYVTIAKNRSERERMSEVKRVSGVFTGAYADHPFTGSLVPIWIADYVLAGYGTGAVMAVPSGDQRDYAFAKHFNLPIVPILDTQQIEAEADPTKEGHYINSDFINGMQYTEATQTLIQRLEEMGEGYGKVNYRIRDAIFGRQRYWGEPIPVYFKDGIPHLVEEKHLPITLPEVDKYLPTEDGEPPLARAKNWTYSPEKGLGDTEGFPLETTTMPGWAGSSWYWFRYMDPKNDGEFASKKSLDYWKAVDLYIGGSEHATGHLLYSRFWCKFLFDRGFVGIEEPFKKLINQGMIQGVSNKVKKVINYWGATKEKHPNNEFSKTKFLRLKLKREGEEEFILELNNPTKDLFVSLDAYSTYFVRKSNIPTLDNETRLTNAIVDETFIVLQEIYANIEDVDIKTPHLDIEKFREREKFNIDTNAVFICKGGFYQNGIWNNIIEEHPQPFITIQEVEKMSKSKHNVVNPDDVMAQYGTDTLRLYEMFLGPLEQFKPWNTNGISGVASFLRKFWRLFHDDQGNFSVSDEAPTQAELKSLHKTIKKVEEDIEKFSFNTSVSTFMICTNELSALKCNKRAILEPLVIVISSYAPHIAEELWSLLGQQESVINADYPIFQAEYLKENEFEYPVSINGKMRHKLTLSLSLAVAEIESAALADATVQKWMEGKAPKKVIIVPGKIINIVI